MVYSSGQTSYDPPCIELAWDELEATGDLEKKDREKMDTFWSVANDLYA